MPISLDFPEITDAFRQFLLLPVRQMAHSFEAIALWLGKRVKTADILEQVSRVYPVIRFQGDAVALWLDGLQAHGLAPDQPVPSFAGRMRDAGDRFAKGIGRIQQQVTQDLILPTAFGTIADALGEIGASVDRFAHPPGAMAEQLFGHSGVGGDDPARRQAGDLWGEAALFWRSLAGSTDQLKDFVGQVRAVHPPPASSGAAAPVDPTPLPDKLDRYARFVLAAVLVLPELPVLAESLWDAVVIRVKDAVIAAFAGIEAGVNKYRIKVLEFVFVEFPRMLRKALSYTIAAQLVLVANVRFFTMFALDYGELVRSQLTTWFEAVADYLNGYIGFVNRLLNAINAILQFDVGGFIAATLAGALGPALAAPVFALMPEITIDDIITAGTDLMRPVARVGFMAFSIALKSAVESAAMGIPLPAKLQNRLDALPKLFWNLFRKPPAYPSETAALRWPAGHHFPDLYDTIFRPGLAGFRSAIDGMARTVPQAATDIAGAGSAALNILGDEFADQAAHVNDATSAARFERLAATAARQAAAVFGPDADDLRDKIAKRKPDTVAESFEGWLAYGGFALLTDAIPAYFKSMRDFWHDEESRGEEATVRIDVTSPRILAERAALARSHVKQVVVKAAGKEVDRSLAETVAAQFRVAVQQAYFDGEARLKLFAVSAYV
jgi:hypothetical protein